MSAAWSSRDEGKTPAAWSSRDEGKTPAAWSSRDEGRDAGRLELAGRGEDAGARDKGMDAGAQDEGRDAAADGGRGKRGGRRRGMRGGRRRRTTARDEDCRTRDVGRNAVRDADSLIRCNVELGIVDRWSHIFLFILEYMYIDRNYNKQRYRILSSRIYRN
jgi:hypothetical protein